MLTCYYTSPQFVAKLRNSPADPYLDGFAEELKEAGYALLGLTVIRDSPASFGRTAAPVKGCWW